MLKLMYITNRPEVAVIAEAAGVDRIFVDYEYIGKDLRQCGMDTVKSHHTKEDVKTISSVLTKAELLVRVNPIHEACAEYCSSKEEIDGAIENGAQILMLPYFKTVAEVETFVRLVDGRAKTMPLLETPEAAEKVDDILHVGGIDEIHVGINDLSLGYGKKFMFELLADGTVERLCGKFRANGLPYGFGGVASLGKGLLRAEYVIIEHYRLGSTRAILSRSFCNCEKIDSTDELNRIFFQGIKEIRDFERMTDGNEELYRSNRDCILHGVNAVVRQLTGL